MLGHVKSSWAMNKVFPLLIHREDKCGFAAKEVVMGRKYDVSGLVLRDLG